MEDIDIETNGFSSKEYTIFLISTLPVMAGATIAPVLPQIAKAFPDESELTIQLILTITALFTGITSLLVGGFIDRYGRRKPLILSLILYGISGSSGLYLNSVNHLLIGRAIFGIAVAGVMTISITLIGDYYSGEKRNKVVGMQATFMTFSGVVFIFLGGLLAELDWHYPFAIFLFAFILLFGVINSLDEPEKKTSSAEIASDHAHESSIKEHALILLFAYSVGFIGVMLFYYVLIFLPFYFEEEFGRGPSEVGMALSINSLFAGVSALNYERLKSRFHYHGIFGGIFVFMGVGSLILAIATSYEEILFGLVLFGLGAGVFGANMNNWLFGNTHAPIRGRVIGGFTTALFIGQFVSPFTGNFILEFTDISGLYMVSAFILLLGALIFTVYARIVDKHED